MTEELKLKPATRKQTYGTSRIGNVYATFLQLKELFGDPHDCTKEGDWESADKKVRVEWAFILNDNKKLVFTIYDYKNSLDLDKVTLWSLGGKNKNPELQDFLLRKKVIFDFIS